VDYAREIDPAWLDGVHTVGVTSGASVPELLVRGVLDFLTEHGYADVEEVVTAQEKLVFSLPRGLSCTNSVPVPGQAVLRPSQDQRPPSPDDGV
jgi:4-hydroxy-3-methylbut-2-en-1-yl diphosphate reductase